MKTFLFVTTIGFVLATLAGVGAPQPLASPTALSAGECNCSNLKVLQIELRNATRLQQAFRNKIADLRKLQGGESQVALKVFAQGEARGGLEPIPDYKGPSEFDYSPWGENQRTFNFPNEQLCGMTESAKVELDKAVAASACAGIGKALRAHEDVHGNMCRSVGYKAYLGMHGADRAQEEVEAYGAQIKVLHDIVDSLGSRCGYNASGSSHDATYSGVVCDLEKPFKVNATGLANFTFDFVPSSIRSGTVSYKAAYSVVTEVGSGTYTVEGSGTEKLRLQVNLSSTATVMGRSTSSTGTTNINLTPLESDECNKKRGTP